MKSPDPNIQLLIGKLAEMFKVDRSVITLQRLQAGLSHQSFDCCVADGRYYVKVYTPHKDVALEVAQINRLTTYMVAQGIPASRIHLYNSKFPNIVVHRFVDAKMHAGQASHIPAIARLYANVAKLGAPNHRETSNPDYLADIKNILMQMEVLHQSGQVVDMAIHHGMRSLGESVISHLQDALPVEGLVHMPLHDDFTEKNILLAGDQVKLLCDWDSYRMKMLWEHLACSVVRFSTRMPLDGDVEKDKLHCFLTTLIPDLGVYIADVDCFAGIFPYLATLKHLRTYCFRNQVVSRKRPALQEPLLAWPLRHCNHLIDDRVQLEQWVKAAFTSYSKK